MQLPQVGAERNEPPGGQVPLREGARHLRAGRLLDFHRDGLARGGLRAAEPERGHDAAPAPQVGRAVPRARGGEVGEQEGVGAELVRRASPTGGFRRPAPHNGPPSAFPLFVEMEFRLRPVGRIRVLLKTQDHPDLVPPPQASLP